jgi:hypothetical protein
MANFFPGEWPQLLGRESIGNQNQICRVSRSGKFDAVNRRASIIDREQLMSGSEQETRGVKALSLGRIQLPGLLCFQGVVSAGKGLWFVCGRAPCRQTKAEQNTCATTYQ